MKPAKFYYSATQENVGKRVFPRSTVTQVFISGKWVQYTEMKSMDNSSAGHKDSTYLGIHPQAWVKVDGIVQDDDLEEYK